MVDSIINETPLAYRTNRIIGGAAPSAYLVKMGAGGAEAPAIDPSVLDSQVCAAIIAFVLPAWRMSVWVVRGFLD